MIPERGSKDGTVIFFGLLLIVGIGVWFFFRSGRNGNDEKMATSAPEQEVLTDFQKISSDDLKNIVLQRSNTEEAFILDTRPTSLWSSEHIIGSKSLTYEDANQSLQPTDDEKKKQWIIIAPDTLSAGSFVALLQKRGVSNKNIRVFDGTYETWKENTGLVVQTADPSSPLDVTKVTLASPENAKANIDGDKQWFILDVRSADLFAGGHIVGAINIPFSEIEGKRATIPSTMNILVYGGDDRESFAGGVLLFDLGFFDVITLSAGFDEWKAKNLPISK